MDGGGLEPTYVPDVTTLTKTMTIRDTASRIRSGVFIHVLNNLYASDLCTLRFYGDKYYLEVMTAKYTVARRSEIAIHIGQVGSIKLCRSMKHQWFLFGKGLKY